jgi:multicomponent K+:H+ antiporter subunit G
MMAVLAEGVAAAFIVIGAFFLFVGSFGLAKLPDLMRRLHAPTKATTLGIGCMLIGSMVWFAGVKGDPSFHELLITLFLFMSAPVTAQMIAKAHILRDAGTQRALPPTGCEASWATMQRDPDAAPVPGDLRR